MIRKIEGFQAPSPSGDGQHGVSFREARLVADVLPAVDLFRSWSRVRRLLRQLSDIGAGGGAPDVLRGELADSLLDISSSYHGREELMPLHALAVFADMADQEVLDVATARAHYAADLLAPSPRMDAAGRVRPGCYETVVETCRRRRDARRLRDMLASTRTSCLLIGSASYGRFSNVRGNRQGSQASDLDLIIVVQTSAELSEIATRLGELPWVYPADAAHLGRRAKIFMDRLDDGRTVFSHKVTLWPDDTVDPMLPAEIAPPSYPLSLHVMTPSVLGHILLSTTPSVLRQTAGSRRTVQDYREAPRARNDHVRSFAGRSYHLRLDAQPTEGGWLRSPQVYYIDPFDAYCPGFYQTMLMLQPDPAWDNLDVRPGLRAFHTKLAERLRYEAARDWNAELRLSFAHIRRGSFTPQVIRGLDVDRLPD
ncbi:hypothetical protein [Micromonospora tulbaghiae]